MIRTRHALIRIFHAWREISALSFDSAQGRQASTPALRACAQDYARVSLESFDRLRIPSGVEGQGAKHRVETCQSANRALTGAYEQERRSCEICGLTLIELLVAMGIAVLLAAVVFAIYAGVLRTLDSQSRWRSAAYPASAALDALTLDLASAVIPWGITNSPFVLTPSLDGADGIKLHFFTATPMRAAPRNTAQRGASLSRSERDVRAYAIREMDYALSVSNAAGTNGLVRAWAAFRIDEAGGMASNRDIWGSVRAIRLEVFDGKRWTNTWGGGTNASLPQAARVMLTVGDASVSRRTSEVLIPAGQRIAAPKSRK